MITLVLHLLGIALLASLGSVILANLAIRFCVKHMSQCLTVIGIVVFCSIMGYGLYKHKPKVHFFDKVSSEVSEELERLPSGTDLHRFVLSQTRQKATVKMDIAPRMDTAIYKVVSVYRKMLNNPSFKPLITSANDYEGHAPTSAHYRGEAVDFRIKDIDFVTKRQIVDAVKETLGSSFLVLHEDAGFANEHLHVQLRKRRMVDFFWISNS